MRFIPLDNFKAMLRATARASNVSAVAQSGTTDNFSFANSVATYQACMPFYAEGATDEDNIATTTSKICFYASEASTISSDTYSIPLKVGKATTTYTQTNTGWSATIQVVASAPAEGDPNPVINSIFMAKRVMYRSAYYDVFTIFALKLDAPVELNAGNNYTAHFTFAIEF